VLEREGQGQGYTFGCFSRLLAQGLGGACVQHAYSVHTACQTGERRAKKRRKGKTTSFDRTTIDRKRDGLAHGKREREREREQKTYLQQAWAGKCMNTAIMSSICAAGKLASLVSNKEPKTGVRRRPTSSAYNSLHSSAELKCPCDDVSQKMTKAKTQQKRSD
jgi:hypothetical protein